MPVEIGMSPSFTSFTGGVPNAEGKGSVLGVTIVPAFVASAGASLTDSVVARIKAGAKFRVLSVQHGNVSTTGATSFDVYNETDNAAIVTDAALSTGTGGSVTTLTNSTVDKGDVLTIRVTTAATSGAISGLTVHLYVAIIGNPDNVA